MANFEAPASGDFATQSLLELIERLAPCENGIVGISVAFYSQLTSALLVAKCLKERNPKLCVALGGPQLSLHGDDLLAMPDVASWVDVICTGPGEATLLHLATRRSEADPRESLPHAYWTSSPDLPPIRTDYDFQSLAPPDFDGLPIREYLNFDYHLATTTCVGCSWGRCAYCSYGNRSLSQKSYRQASPTQLADWCEFLSEKHGGRRINFVDENTNLRLVMSAMRILNGRGVRIRFSTRNRFEKVLLDRAFCAELAERGCVLMSMGYDTNSQRLLNLLDRGVSAEHYQPIIDNLNAVGILPGLSVMGGLPGETEAEVSASEAFLEKNASKIGIDVMQMLVLEKKTRMHQAPGDYELSLDSSDELRGNALLNYGMGRMGPRFDYGDQSSFEQRERRFAQMHQKVRPQKDVDLPPDRRLPSAQPSDMRRDRLAAAKLQPWVRVIRNDGASRSLILADLIWQRVFELRGARVEDDGSLLPVDGVASLHGGIWALVEQGRALPEWSQAC
ncbi:MAG: radical SAM protein [Deltaproteobacteria bacterium]